MRIVGKVNMVLAAVLAGSVVVNFVSLDLTVRPSFEQVETLIADRNYQRVAQTLDNMLMGVADPTRDWGFWNDTFDFIQGKDESYPESNLTLSSLDGLRANYLLLADARQRITFATALEAKQQIAIPELPTTGVLDRRHPFARVALKPHVRTGLMLTSRGIMLMASAPILRSDRTGPAAGTITIGRFLDTKALANQTRVSFEITPLDGASPGVHSNFAEAIQRNGGQPLIEKTDDTLIGRSLLNDLFGQPIAVLEIHTPRTVSVVGRHSIYAAAIALVLAGIAMLLVLRYLLNLIALKRLRRLSQHLAGIASFGTLVPFDDERVDDEIGDLATNFNSMAAQVNELRERLTEQSYYSGMAQWASGILHNVGNSLSPISVMVWKLIESEEAAWKANLRRAVDELKAGDVGDERRDKLQAMLLLGTGKLLDQSEERKQVLQQMRELCRQIEDTLREQDRASRFERARETIELDRVLSKTALKLQRYEGLEIDLRLPKTEQFVSGQRVVVEQIFGNIFANAADAVRAAGKRVAIIKVRVEPASIDGRPALDIAVTDNGEGIPPANLTRIFERGFSTRTDKKGGLGLHWCANSVSAMGGRIYAENTPVRPGATIHVVLEQRRQIEAEAA
jgi:sensor domain CHASE-containing protein